MANQADLPVRTMCHTLGVSVSGFYAWRERAPSQRSIANAVMTERIRQIHKDSYESYGMPRVRAELIEQGVCISRQRVARLMREAGIHGISKRRGFTVTTQRDKRLTPARDLVIDVWSRRVVGWAMGERMTADLVLAALNMALEQRKPKGVIHHSDQGSQGGFNWSSQHLQPGGVYGATRRMDEAIDRERRDALSGGSFASARGRAPVLGTDCNRDHQ